MPAKIQKIPSMIWAYLRSSRIPWVSKFSADEQTRLSWAKIIESYDSVPEVYRNFFEPLLARGREFPYAVLTPSREGFMQRTSEKLVCEFDSKIHILEKAGDSFELQCFPVHRISFIETRSVLLESSIKITGVTDRGKTVSSFFRFNSVTDYLFTPILIRIRRSIIPSRKGIHGSETGNFDHWARLSFKFMNYARHSMLDGDRVVQSFLQPEIRTNVARIFGKTYYLTISPTHASILTDRELIMIREEARRGGEDRYGGIRDYIPLNKIVNLSLRIMEDNLLSLLIQLPDDVQLEFLYQISAREDLNKFIAHFKDLIV